MSLMNLAKELFPICRSITGNGLRKTLDIIGKSVPLKITEYPTGTKVFDWEIPKEWNIKDAYVKDKQGNKIIDFKASNLHILNYSTPINTTLSGKELKKNIYTLPEMPNAIPYVTSYYSEKWGFCIEHSKLAEIKDDEEYEVLIDSTLEDGYLTIAEGFIQGKTNNEILLSTYVCHPSMANNELSGPIVQTEIYKYLLGKKEELDYSYRFLYLPETIGSITYLATHGRELKQKVKAGFVITCCGDEVNFTYKRSRTHNSLSDRAVINVLNAMQKDYKDLEWFPYGSDERQYCSTGFNLPIGSLMKSMYGDYSQYHTSLDNLDFITEKGMQESISTYIDIIEGIELNKKYTNQNPNCEPKLGKRGLFPNTGGQKQVQDEVKKLMYLLAYSDGNNDIIYIADKLNIKAKELKESILKLTDSGLLK